MAETLIHARWPAKENGNILVCGIDSGKGCLAQLHQKRWDTRFGFDILVVPERESR